MSIACLHSPSLHLWFSLSFHFLSLLSSLCLSTLLPPPFSLSLLPCWYFCYLLRLKATGPWCDWAAVFSMLELVFYNATRQGQTWWIASFHYCHLKDCSLEEEREEVVGWGWVERNGQWTWRVEKVSDGGGRGREAGVAWLTECQINCPSLIRGPATSNAAPFSPHGISGIALCVFFLFKLKGYIYSDQILRWSERLGGGGWMKGGEKKNEEKIFQERTLQIETSDKRRRQAQPPWS